MTPRAALCAALGSLCLGAVVSGCGHPSARSPSITPLPAPPSASSAAPRGTSVAVSRTHRYLVAPLNAPAPGSPDGPALGQAGRLTWVDGRCLGIRGPDGVDYVVAWPHRMKVERRPFAIRGADGTRTAVGDAVSLVVDDRGSALDESIYRGSAPSVCGSEQWLQASSVG